MDPLSTIVTSNSAAPSPDGAAVSPLTAVLALLDALETAGGHAAFARELAAACAAEMDPGRDSKSRRERRHRLFTRLEAAKDAMWATGIEILDVMKDDDAIAQAMAAASIGPSR